jgi:hypothetical protein
MVEPKKKISSAGGDNDWPDLKKEDPRLADATVPVEEGYTVVKDVKIGYLTDLGKGEEGGRTGAIEGKKNSDIG